MTDNKTIALFFDLLNRRDLDKMGAMMTEDVVFLFPKTQPLQGPERIARFFNILFRRYPELSFAVKRTIVEKDWAAVHWTNRGVSRKKEPYENEGVTLLESDQGKIRFISDFFKDTGKF